MEPGLSEDGMNDEPAITGEMSEEAITKAAIANDAEFRERLSDLYSHFVDIGVKAKASLAFEAAQNAFGNAMNIANSMHNIAIIREQIVRKRLDLFTTRVDLDLEGDGSPEDDADAVDEL